MNKHIQQLNKLKNPDKFWEYFLEHKDKLKLILDNDDTIVVPLMLESDDDYTSASNYLGNSEGIGDLLTALKINWEEC